MNPKVEALNDAFDLFTDVIEEYAAKNNLPAKDKTALLKMAREAFQEQKISYFLEDRLHIYHSFLNIAMRFALNKKEDTGFQKR